MPDAKDRAWVLRRPCPACGLDVQSFPREEVAGMVRANAPAWHRVLTRTGDARQRRLPGTWSALEYGCHVRHVLCRCDQRPE